jgi:hypothetical protein
MRNALKHVPGAAARRLLPIATAPLLAGTPACRCQPPSKARRQLQHGTSVRCLENGHEEADAGSGVSSANGTPAYLLDAALMSNEMATDPALLAALVDILSSDAQEDHAAAGPQEPAPRAAKGRSGYHGFCLNCCAPTVISFCEVGVLHGRDRMHVQAWPAAPSAARSRPRLLRRQVCGHDASRDEELLSLSSAPAAAPAPAPTPAASAAAGIFGIFGNGASSKASAGTSSAAGASSGAAAAAAPGGVLLGYNEAMLQHRALMHPNPERPERLLAIMARLRNAGLTE